MYKFLRCFYRSEKRMKLMTLNTHSLVESSYEEKKEKFIETLIVEQPDVVALQEVN